MASRSAGSSQVFRLYVDSLYVIADYKGLNVYIIDFRRWPVRYLSPVDQDGNLIFQWAGEENAQEITVSSLII